jgi:2-C-methyl-D-erythritol 2,4-cyclodiphosphate synthase
LFRVGFGYDVHCLVKGRDLIIGGVKIPHTMGLMGHSDADVLTHAIMDGILGALAKGDIGGHFPDNDPQYKDINSLSILKKVMEFVKQDNYLINNIDNTIVAEEPKLAPHIPAMIDKLSRVLEIDATQLNVKATTSEGMGFCGHKEGIAAYSIVSLINPDPNTK